MSEPETVSQSNEHKTSTLNRALKILALPVSLLTGGVFAHSLTRNKSYDNLKHRGAFELEHSALNADARKLLPEWGVTKDVSHELKQLDKIYSAKIDKRLEELGYKSIFTRFNNLHHNQKLEVVMTGVTAGAVMLGVMLTLADHKSLFDRLTGSEHDRDDTPGIL